jgi:acetylornithine/N-succinyldiaminopimelate aminotransferase
MADNHLMNVYLPLPIMLERGDGAWLWDTEGNRYLDVFSGIAVTILGHAHPVVTAAIHAQVDKLLHISNLFQTTQQEKLSDLLCGLSGLDKAFFCNSGAEAVETILKLIRLYGHQKGIESPETVVMTNAFHGRTLATISAGGSKKAQEGFHPLVPGFVRVPYNDISALESIAKTNPNIAAVLIEPIQGESGINLPSEDYLIKVRQLCDQNGWLMALDEIQCGMARTGTFLACQAYGILPDIVSLAKGLANGVPIGACLATNAVAALFKPGNHGSTFGGNPLATAAALATLTEIKKHKLWENAKTQGQKLLQGLQERLKGNPHVKEIRGKGLMIGIELDRPCREILMPAAKAGLLFNIANERVIRLLPALIFEEEHVNQVINTLPRVIEEFINSTKAV